MIRRAPRTRLIEMVMPKRNVLLMDSQAEFVEQMVASGHYQIASEVLRDGLGLVQAREAEQATKPAALREAVVVGLTLFGVGAKKRDDIRQLAQGSMTARPAALKGLESRVATIMPRAAAVAAM